MADEHLDKPSPDKSNEKKIDAALLRDGSSFTFRVNKNLKEEFIQLCRKEHYSVAVALKRYMFRCVEKGEIIDVSLRTS